MDVARADDVQAAARSILAKHGQIDLLVNNAGLNVPERSWKELEIGGWDQVVTVNLSGVLYFTRPMRCCLRCETASPAASSTPHHGPAESSPK